MSSKVPKHPALLDVLRALKLRFGEGALIEVDHWPDDPQAIEVSSPAQPGALAYISVWPESAAEYFVGFESAPSGEWSDHPYTLEGDRNVYGIDDLCGVMATHFQLADA